VGGLGTLQTNLLGAEGIKGAVETMRVRFVPCLAGVAAVWGLAVPQFVQGRNLRPKGFIAAKPSALVVNETTMLEGTDFPANERIVLRECPKMAYGPDPMPAYKHPCDPTTKTVETDASGTFTVAFQVRSCLPNEQQPKRATKCYVGEYIKGVDTIMLIGAVKLTVSP
jgi:hypothetical protein